MTFYRAIDAYIDDMWSAGRIRSKRTETGYRAVLVLHADDVSNRDPATTDRNDVKRTLRRWPKPNTQRVRRAVLVSFYDWAMEEGKRRDNPARQTPRPRKQPTNVYRLTREEVAALLAAAQSTHERRAIHLGLCAGLRNSELRGLQGRHLEREGFVWVSGDIAKGGHQRWVPVLFDLEPVFAEALEHVAYDEYVLPAMRWRNPPFNTQRLALEHKPMSSQALRQLVMRVAKRAGIGAHIHPHLLRHAFGDHIARYAGIKNAQALLGHASVSTTETYTGQPTLDELAGAVRGLRFVPTASSRTGSPAAADGTVGTLDHLQTLGLTDKAPTGIEPVQGAVRATVGDLVSTECQCLAEFERSLTALVAS